MRRIIFLFVAWIFLFSLGSSESQSVLRNDSLEDKLYSATQAWFQADLPTVSCSECISLLELVKGLSYLSEDFVISTLSKLCGSFDQVNTSVCKGAIKEQAPILVKVLKTMSISGRDGHLLCAAVLNTCPYPEVEPWQLTFPKPKPLNPTSPPSFGKTFKVLHLSDWHVDPEYQPGSEAYCDKPICCRADNTDSSNITAPASLWGAYTCDTPLALIESLLRVIPTIAPTLEFGLLTGDIPPHEIWSTLPVIKTQLIEEESYILLHAHFDSPEDINTVLYPAVGNHESAPTNMFPLMSSSIPTEKDKQYLNLKWLYQSLAASWTGWLSSHTIPTLETNHGSYVEHPTPGLKLIVLNTNFCYNMNWWLYEHPMEKDPNGILEWLINHLQASEDIDERVWITGHVPPGDSTCFHDFSNYYNQIVQRYAPHVIAGQFFGHTHKDEFQIFYSGDSQEAENAISVAYIGPSITPYLNINPGFRVYEVDAHTFEIVDTLTYIVDLDHAQNSTTAPPWRLEYSARQAYNTPDSPIHDTTSPLTPAWWHNVTRAMENDASLFDKYWKFRVKSAPMPQECTDVCREIAICNIRAGNAEKRCDYKSKNTPDDGRVFHREEHACGFRLKGHRH